MLIVRPQTQCILNLPIAALLLAGVSGVALVRAIQRLGLGQLDSSQVLIGLLLMLMALGYAIYSLGWFRRHGEEIWCGWLAGRNIRPIKGSCLQGSIVKGSRTHYLEIWLVTRGLPNIKMLTMVYNHKAEPKARRIAEALGIPWIAPL